MLHHAVVIAIIAGPLGLFSAMVATGYRAFGSDLARVGWIGILLIPVLVIGAWEVSLLFWLTAVSKPTAFGDDIRLEVMYADW